MKVSSAITPTTFRPTASVSCSLPMPRNGYDNIGLLEIATKKDFRG
jgi:hypothetical protein